MGRWELELLVSSPLSSVASQGRRRQQKKERDGGKRRERSMDERPDDDNATVVSMALSGNCSCGGGPQCDGEEEMTALAWSAGSRSNRAAGVRFGELPASIWTLV